MKKGILVTALFFLLLIIISFLLGRNLNVAGDSISGFASEDENLMRQNNEINLVVVIFVCVLVGTIIGIVVKKGETKEKIKRKELLNKIVYGLEYD